MKRRSTRIAATLFACLLTHAAWAQQPAPVGEPDGNKALAKEWADKAKTSFDMGDYPAAIAAMQEAWKHARPPTFARFLAQANDKAGNLLEARRYYQSVIDTKLDASAPDPWKTAQEESKKELATLQKRIPTLRITVLGAAVSSLQMKVDGATFDLNQLGSPVQLNPGKHTIVAVAAGKTESREVTLKEKDAQDLNLKMGAEAPPPVTASVPVVTAAPTTSAGPTAPQPTGAAAPPPVPTTTAASSGAPQAGADSSGKGPPPQTYVAYGIGLAGFVATGVFGGMYLSKRDEFNKARTTDLADEADRLGIGAGIAFAVGLIGSVAGTVAWLTPPLDPPKKKGVSSVQLMIGPTNLTVRGKF